MIDYKGSKQITCVVPLGLGPTIVKALKEEKNVIMATVGHARASLNASSHLEFSNEIDILSVIVDAERADEIFSFIYDEAEIGLKPGSFLYQSNLNGLASYALPSIEKV